MENKIKGGRADNRSEKDFCPKQLKTGTDHEMEHTSDRSKAQEIAMDHLAEDADYYTKLKDIEKYDRIDEEADGKKEFDYGKEELNKGMTIEDLRTAWGRLKKALDSSKSIMNIEEQEEVPDEEDQEQPVEQDQEMDAADASEVSQDDGEVAPEGGEEQESEPDEAEQNLINALKEDGHSDQEIDYIMHGHIVPQATEDDYSAENERAGGEQELQNDQMDAQMQRQIKQREADRDHDHKGKMNDLEHQRASMDMDVADPEYERQHKQRMLDLEYEKAKAEMDMDLEFKQKELEQKMKLKEEAAKTKKKEQASAKPKK